MRFDRRSDCRDCAGSLTPYCSLLILINLAAGCSTLTQSPAECQGSVIRDDERILRVDIVSRSLSGLESAEQIWYNIKKPKERFYEPAGNKRLSRAYLL
jgi:hypothetical protein